MLLLPPDALPEVLLLPVLLLMLPLEDEVDEDRVGLADLVVPELGEVLRLGVRLVTVLELVDVLRLGVLPELPDTALLVLDEELRVT